MAILLLDFFGSDPSKMDQTFKFGEQTSRILEFKPEFIKVAQRNLLFTVHFHDSN